METQALGTGIFVGNVLKICSRKVILSRHMLPRESSMLCSVFSNYESHDEATSGHRWLTSRMPTCRWGNPALLWSRQLDRLSYLSALVFSSPFSNYQIRHFSFWGLKTESRAQLKQEKETRRGKKRAINYVEIWQECEKCGDKLLQSSNHHRGRGIETQNLNFPAQIHQCKPVDGLHSMSVLALEKSAPMKQLRKCWRLVCLHRLSYVAL